MARNTRPTTCSKEKKILLDRMAKALGLDITQVVDFGIDAIWKKNKRRILAAERAQTKIAA